MSTDHAARAHKQEVPFCRTETEERSSVGPEVARAINYVETLENGERGVDGGGGRSVRRLMPVRSSTRGQGTKEARGDRKERTIEFDADCSDGRQAARN